MTATPRELTHGLSESTQKEAWLLGQPPLRKFLDFVEETAIGGDRVKQSLLVDQWRIANDLYYELEKSEGGIAQTVDIRELDASLAMLAEDVRRDSRFRRAYEIVPTRFAMVELDKLVVSQQHVNLTHAESARAKLGSAPSVEDLFRACLPLGQSGPEVRMRKTGAKRYVMWSPSSDIRFHEAASLTAGQISDYESFGPIGAVLGLVVGFGSNFLNAIESDNRLVLNNGHHRAYALRDLGLTHAPCLIQTVTRVDELGVAASGDICDMASFYFKSPRPPLLKDFFDPRLRMVLTIPKLVRMIELSFEVRDFEVKDFAEAG